MGMQQVTRKKHGPMEEVPDRMRKESKLMYWAQKKTPPFIRALVKIRTFSVLKIRLSCVNLVCREAVFQTKGVTSMQHLRELSR